MERCIMNIRAFSCSQIKKFKFMVANESEISLSDRMFRNIFLSSLILLALVS